MVKLHSPFSGFLSVSVGAVVSMAGTNHNGRVTFIAVQSVVQAFLFVDLVVQPHLHLLTMRATIVKARVYNNKSI